LRAPFLCVNKDKGIGMTSATGEHTQNEKGAQRAGDWRRWLPLAAVLAAAWPVAAQLQLQGGGRTLVFALALGLLLGLVLQRSRFCFYCHARDWFELGRHDRGAG
jgi:hypothetical protein